VIIQLGDPDGVGQPVPPDVRAHVAGRRDILGVPGVTGAGWIASPGQRWACFVAGLAGGSLVRRHVGYDVGHDKDERLPGRSAEA
jgi:hypothetical protein